MRLYAMTTNKDELLIFLHIQKTAGSSLRNFVKRQYQRNQVWFGRSLSQLDDMDTDHLRCFGGHFNYGLHEKFDRPYSYFTILREPVDRVLSYYYFLQNKESSGKHDLAANMDILQFMEELATKTQNYQTRRITGGNPNLELAKQHLLEDFSFVGLKERFKESLFLLKKEYEWPNLQYNNRNVTAKRPEKAEISPAILDVIAEKNQMDIELYNFSAELFAERIQRLTPQERESMNKFLTSP